MDENFSGTHSDVKFNFSTATVMTLRASGDSQKIVLIKAFTVKAFSVKAFTVKAVVLNLLRFISRCWCCSRWA